VSMDPSEPKDEGTPPSEPMGTPPPPQGQIPPPPQQSWQSQPQQPAAPPPPGGGPMGGGTPSWTSNITASGTIPGPMGMALSDIPNRIIASVIDFIILGIVGFIVGAIIHPILGEDIFGGILGVSVKVPSLLSSIVVVAIMLAVSAGYFIYMWTRMFGSTVGMRVVKLRVVDATSGTPIIQKQAINRWLMLGAPWALTFFYSWSIGWIITLGALAWYVYLLVTTAQSPTRQGAHDKYANTVVTKLG